MQLHAQPAVVAAALQGGYARFVDIGAWLKQNGAAIYATRPLAPFACASAAYTMAKDSSAGYAIIKNPSKTVELAYTPADGAKFTALDGGREIKWRYKDAANKKGAVLSLPDSLANSPLPVAVKFNIK